MDAVHIHTAEQSEKRPLTQRWTQNIREFALLSAEQHLLGKAHRLRGENQSCLDQNQNQSRLIAFESTKDDWKHLGPIQHFTT